MSKGAGIALLRTALGGTLGGYVVELPGLRVPVGFCHDIFIKRFTMVVGLIFPSEP